jgi:CheY-like chemotaxis protein
MMPRRVLIVEDNADSRNTLRTLIRLWGHEVQAAADGASGVETALNWKPEVAVVDIGLPLLDGFEVARQIRADVGNGIRLIALTAYGDPADRRRGFDAGFDEYLIKPADVDELQRLLA